MDTGARSRRGPRRGFHPLPVRQRAGSERKPPARSPGNDKDAALAAHGEDAGSAPEFAPPRDERAG